MSCRYERAARLFGPGRGLGSIFKLDIQIGSVGTHHHRAVARPLFQCSPQLFLTILKYFLIYVDKRQEIS